MPSTFPSPNHSRFGRTLAVLLVVAGTAGPTSPAFGQGGNIVTVAQYEGIRDPLEYDMKKLAVWKAPTMFGVLNMYIETERLQALNILGATDAQIDDATAVAITTSTIKTRRLALEPALAGGRLVLAKLTADLKTYEKRYPNFATADLDTYKPTDTAEKRFWERYSAIKQALRKYEYEVDARDPNDPTRTTRQKKTLVDAEKTLGERAKAVIDGLLEIEGRLTRVKYALSHLKDDGGFLAPRLEALHETLFGLQHMAVRLNEEGKTPRNQFRATFTNQAPNLVFFVQIHAKGPNGEYAVRPDTAVPVTVYPTLWVRDPANPDKKEWAKKPDLQLEPFGPRGPNEVWLPLNPGDKLVIRAATMGLVRDRIRTQPIAGRMVRPDKFCYTRGFYYLGYEVTTPEGMKVSRWIPEDESYRWTLGGFLADSQRSGFLKLVETDPKTLREFDPQSLKLSQDRLECVLPSSVELMTSISEDSKAFAEVTGTARFKRVGPLSTTPNPPITEEAAGKIEVLVEKW